MSPLTIASLRLARFSWQAAHSARLFWVSQCFAVPRRLPLSVVPLRASSSRASTILPLYTPTMSDDLESLNEYFSQKILPGFPDGIQCSFAYGSGAFQQQGTEHVSKNMLDFIFVVDDPVAWHSENLQMNRRHYSALKFLGTRAITHIQQQYGAGIYFNTLVMLGARLIKYGIVSTERLITDLLDWETLYMSGRLHKPVLTLKQPTNPDLIVALDNNLHSAVHAALLQLPDTFTEEELYMSIANLSYSGDFRMSIGEDRNKVSNIVVPNIPKFRSMYCKILESEEHVFYNQVRQTYEQYPNHISQYHHLNLLPKTVHVNLVSLCNHNRAIPDTEDVLRNLANDPHCGTYVAKCISDIVKRSSYSQSIKTILTAGFLKSVKYSSKKLLKMVRSVKNKN